MASEYSPFSPGQPVGSDLFTGREDELKRLFKHTNAASQGRFSVVFLTGERGIGKSSIASLTRYAATSLHNMLTAHVFLAGVHAVDSAVQNVFDRLLNESRNGKWSDRIHDLFTRYIKEVGLFGTQISFAPKPEELQRLTSSFDDALAAVYSRVSDDASGIMLVLDDINGLARSAEFANWIKRFVDTVSTKEPPLPLFLMLVGHEDRRRELIQGHESLARVFDVVDIRPWSDEEVAKFYQKAFGSIDMVIDDVALDIMVQYTGGLPVIAHEIGDAVFQLTEANGKVTSRLATHAVMRAAHIVGLKHLEPKVFEAIQSKRYRSILATIASERGLFKRGEVLNKLEEEERRVVDNFLQKMKGLDVLEQVPAEGPGYWRFTSNLHHIYFMLQSHELSGGRPG